MSTATPIHGSITRVYADAYDLTPFMRNSEAEESFDVADATGFGAAASTHVVDPRQKGSITADGMFAANNATSGITGGTVHTALTAANGQANHFVAHVCQDVLGGQAAALYGTINDYKADNVTNDVVKASFAAVSNIGIDWAEVLHPVLATTETAAGNSSGVDDGAGASTTSGAVMYLMVLALTGTSITVKLQSSTTIGGAYADVSGGAFTAVNSPGAGVGSCQRLVIPSGTTINRAVRAAWTGTFSSATFLCLFARN